MFVSIHLLGFSVEVKIRNPPADMRRETSLPTRICCLPVSVLARCGLVNRRQNLELLVFVLSEMLHMNIT
jgi:hypothetical protein